MKQRTIYALLIIIATISITGCSVQPEEDVIMPPPPTPPGIEGDTIVGAAYVTPTEAAQFTRFAPPWDVWNNNQLFITFSEEEPSAGSSVSINIDDVLLVYNKAYITMPTGNGIDQTFKEFTLTGTQSKYPQFYAGGATGIIPTQYVTQGSHVIAVYACTNIITREDGKKYYACGCMSNDYDTCRRWNLQRLTVREQQGESGGEPPGGPGFTPDDPSCTASTDCTCAGTQVPTCEEGLCGCEAYSATCTEHNDCPPCPAGQTPKCSTDGNCICGIWGTNQCSTGDDCTRDPLCYNTELSCNSDGVTDGRCDCEGLLQECTENTDCTECPEDTYPICTGNDLCACSRTPPQTWSTRDGICDSEAGENKYNSPDDCDLGKARDGVCASEEGENWLNSPDDCYSILHNNCAPAGFAPGQSYRQSGSAWNERITYGPCCDYTEPVSNPVYEAGGLEVLSMGDVAANICLPRCVEGSRDGDGNCPTAEELGELPPAGNPPPTGSTEPGICQTQECMDRFTVRDFEVSMSDNRYGGTGFAQLSDWYYYALSYGITTLDLQGFTNLRHILREDWPEWYSDFRNDFNKVYNPPLDPVTRMNFTVRGTGRSLWGDDDDIARISTGPFQGYLAPGASSFWIDIHYDGKGPYGSYTPRVTLADMQNCVLEVARPSTTPPYYPSEDYEEIQGTHDGEWYQAEITMDGSTGKEGEGWYDFRITCETVGGPTGTAHAEMVVRRETIVHPYCLKSDKPLPYAARVGDAGVYDPETETFTALAYPLARGDMSVARKILSPGETTTTGTIPGEEPLHATVSYEEVANAGTRVENAIDPAIEDLPINAWGSDIGVYIPGVWYDTEDRSYRDEFGVDIIKQLPYKIQTKTGTGNPNNRLVLIRPPTQAEWNAFWENNEYRCEHYADAYPHFGCYNNETIDSQEEWAAQGYRARYLIAQGPYFDGPGEPYIAATQNDPYAGLVFRAILHGSSPTSNWESGYTLGSCIGDYS